MDNTIRIKTRLLNYYTNEALKDNDDFSIIHDNWERRNIKSIRLNKAVENKNYSNNTNE